LVKKPEDRDALYFTGQLLVDATKLASAKTSTGNGNMHVHILEN
jgi:hypothetical protein